MVFSVWNFDFNNYIKINFIKKFQILFDEDWCINSRMKYKSYNMLIDIVKKKISLNIQ